jgi:hypothetical protein
MNNYFNHRQESEVTVTWKAFGEPTSATIWFRNDDYPPATPLGVCAMLFSQTNLYKGHLWDLLETVLPENRTHTALSVGDEVTVDGVTHRCQPVGWLEVVTA